MATAKVIHDSVVGTYEIRMNSYQFDKIKEVIACIKQFVPASDRTYSPLTKSWTVLEWNAAKTMNYWVILEPIIKHHGFHVQLEEKEVAVDPAFYAQDFFYEQAPTGAQAESASTIAQKLSIYLGVEIKAQELTDLKRLYRQKARELHPDLGGDATAMSELNRLWTLFTARGVQ